MKLDYNTQNPKMLITQGWNLTRTFSGESSDTWEGTDLDGRKVKIYDRFDPPGLFPMSLTLEYVKV